MSRYENYEIKNNVFGTLSAPISSLATTIQLGDGQGARFSENMLATLENIENGKVMKREIVLITAINGDVLTVERKYVPCPANDEANTQGQVSYAFSTDDTISAYITKEHFKRVEDGFNNTNDEIDDILANGDDKLRTYKTTGLGIEVKGGPVLVGNSYYDFAGGTLTLTNNATNYIEIDEDGNLVSNTISRGDKNTKISKVITSGGVVSSIEDWRLGTVGGKIGGVEIHELTEKDILNPDDEFIIADSENIRQNKKIKANNILGYKKSICANTINKGDIVGEHTNFDKIPTAVQFIGNITDNQKVATKVYGTGIESDFIKLYLCNQGNGQDVTVRIETENNGLPSGTLVDVNATGTVASTDLTSSLVETQIDFADSITLTKDTPYWLVIIGTTIDSSNFIRLGVDNNIFNRTLAYDGNDWKDTIIGGTTQTLINGSQNGGYAYPTTITLQANFNQKIFLEKFSMQTENYWGNDTTLTITNLDTSAVVYTGNVKSTINIYCDSGINYQFQCVWGSGYLQSRNGTVSGVSCAICNSISYDYHPLNGGQYLFLYKAITPIKKTYIKSQLFNSFLYGIDTSNINTFSDIVGIAIGNGNEGDAINIAIDGGTVSNDSRDLTPGQDYFFISNTISNTPIASTNIIYLGKAISKIAIRVDIKKALYNLSSDIAPFTGLNSGNPIYKGETVSGTLTAGY